MSGRVDPLFKLRLPDFIREKLEAEATRNRRSITAEILERLENSFSDREERLNGLEKEVFDGMRGNQNLHERLETLELMSRGIDPFNRED
nr:Arc family DNA-binding protein [uncultured Lichenicoccus sp.]